MLIMSRPSASQAEQLARVNRTVGEIAQHDPYLFWLCCTVYRQRSLVVLTPDEQVVGYLLSIPDCRPRTEFLLQIVVLAPWRKHETGSRLLKCHWSAMLESGIATVRTSVHRSSRRGMALMRRARGMGHRYREISWDICGTVPDFASQEILYEAPVVGPDRNESVAS